MNEVRRVPKDGPFRNPQSFTLFRVDQLIEKLRWDLAQLETLRWEEDLGNAWRQLVSYKAIDCATSAWHLLDWFAADVRALDPQTRLCTFLEIKGHDPYTPLLLSELRAAAMKKCPDLELCRVVAIASKHYQITQAKPRPDVRTATNLAVARRGDEPFMRPVMWVAVFEGDVRRDMREVFFNCLRFWEEVAYVARPGSPWAPTQAIPPEVHLPLPHFSTELALKGKPHLDRGNLSPLRRILSMFLPTR